MANPQYKNLKNTSLSVAVWLAHDSYDHNPDPNTISVTTLIKPIKQIVLGMRAKKAGVVESREISENTASSMGTAFHDSIEDAWVNNYKTALAKLGYPQKIIDRIVVNPTVIKDGDIPVYLERRSSMKIGGLTVSGKFDFVGEGRVEDFKSTSTYSYTSGTKDGAFILQGSLYRLLNQDIITRDDMAIQYIFTDWKPTLALSDKGYPQSRVLEHKLNLMDVDETHRWAEQKVHQIITLKDVTEDKMPDCTQEDLWQSVPKYKYYKNQANATKPGGRSTKNFDSIIEANIKLADDNYVGVVVTVPGEVRACKYCDAFNACKQKDGLIASGSLKVGK
jgi:hypothetical protein